MSNKKQQIPDIRFKGFTDDWEQRKLGELINLENGFAFKSEYFQEDPSDVIVLTPGNVNIGGGFQSGKGRFYNIAGKFPDKFIFKPGDIFVTMTDLTPSGQTLGLPAIVPDDGITYLHNQRLGKLVNFSGDREFLFYVFNTEDYHKHIVATASGTTVKHSSSSKILDYVVHIPIIEEQTKIGAFLNKLDNTIALHQRQLYYYKELKKATLQKMFPREGETIPEVRFEGFTEEWEQRTLGELMDISSASRVHKNEWTKSGVRFFRSSDVIASYNKKKNTEAFISHELYEELSSKSGKVSQGDILITGGGSIGIPYLIKDEEPLYFKDADLIWLKNSEKLNGYFLFTYFITNGFRQYLGSISHIGTISHYTIEQAKVTPISLPNEKEQDQLGSFFEQLDNAIALHQQKIINYQTAKSALFKKMFV